MASSGATLQIKMGTMSGVKTWNFSHVAGELELSTVKTLAQALIDNGSIYKYPPLTAESAQLIVTQVTSYEMN